MNNNNLKLNLNFKSLRILSCSILLMMYYVPVWFTSNERQSIFCNIDERKFYFFSYTFWPDDLIILSLIIIVFAFTLFFITVLFGRIWCGYACPQSTFMWIFSFFYKLTASAFYNKNNSTRYKNLSKILKHVFWLLISFITAVTFVGYFYPIRLLIQELITLRLSFLQYICISFFTLATYINAGVLREKICIFMCPYARFQGVMFDQNTYTISYDPRLGEKRGSRRRKKNTSAEVLGNCIDCTMCVKVCPTGIDIRQGLQLECIACAACLDICDSVMKKINYPKGLIKYTTENNLNGKTTKIIRMRLIIYGIVLALMIITLIIVLFRRPLTGFDVIKDHIIYRENEKGQIENIYKIKILNKDKNAHTYILGIKSSKFKLIGSNKVKLYSGESVTIPLSIAIDAKQLTKQNNNIIFTVTYLDNPTISQEKISNFIGPHSPN